MAKVLQSNNAKFLNKNFCINKTHISIGEWFPEKISLGSVINMKVDINQHVGKSAGGTIGGAIVGGVLTGGIGAIVGGLACGNNKLRTTKLMAIEFENKDWIVVSFEDRFVDRVLFDETQRRIGAIQINPFSG